MDRERYQAKPPVFGLNAHKAFGPSVLCFRLAASAAPKPSSPGWIGGVQHATVPGQPLDLRLLLRSTASRRQIEGSFGFRQARFG